MTGFANVFYPCNGILLSHKKEWTTETCYNMDESQNNYAEWKTQDLKDYMLYESIYIIS